ncbi:TonB-dependent receptor [Lutibacter sp. HS1-25]|uniref:SusC/RagA family TonB-linked outer membrane protein n=1 Tax=Lutibacter sp. HS1-25 TaxID=2485000 RepID=UPI0010110468|nr:TonB-dependent receptor [Lutibacter sp. HS1-25]RXP45222.1 TonB-dependent receptor [Lutibacter sp. HS1-25]
MNLKIKLTILLALLLNLSLVAQSGYLMKGVVVTGANNDPIPGASLLVKGSTKGTTSDFDGNFQLEVKAGDILQISFVGFETKEIIIANQNNLSIKLSEAQNQLDEVVVIGYGSQKKSHLTGSISKVVNEELSQIAVARVDEALTGQVSGVSISNTDGSVGSAPTIRIRGTGSITGDSGPLVVVDGLVMDSDILGNLDMNDIESFEVLKDAASAAIYGSRGGNGVIMITTKNGKQGDTKFSFSTYAGIKEAKQSKEYYFSVAETAAAELAATGAISAQTQYKQLIGVDQDWQDIIFDGGTITSYNLSARGGSEKTRFSAAMNYLHDEGVLLTDDFKKYGLKLKLDTKVSKKVSFGVSITPSYTDTRRFDGSTHDILRQPPWLPLYLDENTIQFVNRTQDGGKWANAQIGDYAQQMMFDGYDLTLGMPVASGGTNISNTSNTNPGAKVLERDRNDYKFKVFSSVFLKYDIIDDLSFTTSLSHTYNNTERSRYQGTLSSRNGVAATQMDYQNQVDNRIVSTSYFSYDKTFGKNDLGVILGYEAETAHSTYSAIRGTGYNTDDVKTINNAAVIAAANELEWEQTLQSLISRVTYAYDDKYLASFSYRRDGSSIFGSDYKWGNFPAGSIGWRVSQEDFLSDSRVVSNLKFRVSYGVTGNNNINLNSVSVEDSKVLGNFYPSLALLQAETYNGQSAFNPINIANNLLQWERSVEFNPGVDFGFLNGAITGTFDYYNRKSDHLLLDNPISSTTGFSSALVNLGEVENYGYELELRGRIFNKQKFKWSATWLSSWNQNNLVDFAEANGQIQSVDEKRAAEWINLEGNPISSFYGWVVDKQIPLEYLKNPYHPVGGQAQDVYVKDLNGDGLIDDDDKTILGNPYPDFIWSLTNDFKIGDFDVTFMFQGSHGAQVRNMADQYIFNHFNSSQDFDPVTTPDQQFIKEKIYTNSIVQDASFVVLRNVNIGFNFPDQLMDKWKMDGLRVYATGNNLMYLFADGYTGFNPESIDDTSPTTYGYQRGGNPIARTISLGINLDF